MSVGTTSMTELWHFPTSEVTRLIRSGKVSTREVADAALQRLDSVNPRINAIVECRPDLVREQADHVDGLLAQGKDPGPLAGVPVTLKINIDQAGFATTDGSRVRKDWVAKSNSPVVDNLVRSGAVLLGRSNSPTFALRWFTSNVLYGSTRNPRDPLLTPGGSGGGGAAALAAGIGHIAIGTDGGGSVRYPAYAGGVHGIRPSLGRVPATQRILAGGHHRAPNNACQGAHCTYRPGSSPQPRRHVRCRFHEIRGRCRRPLEGSPMPLCAALCVRPGGMSVAEEVAVS